MEVLCEEAFCSAEFACFAGMGGVSFWSWMGGEGVGEFGFGRGLEEDLLFC